MIQPLPILAGSEVVGWGRMSDRAFSWRRLRSDETQRCTWTGYDDALAEATAGKLYTKYYWKMVSTFPTQNIWYDWWCLDGAPDAGAYSGTAFTARQLDDTMGGVQHGGNVSPDTKHFLGTTAAMTPDSPTVGIAVLYDRVIAYENNTIGATSQNFTNTLTAQRYAGAGLPGLQMMLTAQAVPTTGSQTLTSLIYVNQANTGSQAVPVSSLALPATWSLPSHTVASRVLLGSLFVPLAAGDTGVRSATSFQFSGLDLTATFCLALVRPIAFLTGMSADAFSTNNSSVHAIRDRLRQINDMERIYDGAHLSVAANIMITSASAQNVFHGMITPGWG